MILDEIAAATRLRVEQLQRIKDLNKVRSDAESLPKNNRGFRTRLSRDGMNFITEVKKASPSKGIISKEFDYLRLARDYEAAGAAAISCLTEPQFFLLTIPVAFIYLFLLYFMMQLWETIDFFKHTIELVCFVGFHIL